MSLRTRLAGSILTLLLLAAFAYRLLDRPEPVPVAVDPLPVIERLRNPEKGPFEAAIAELAAMGPPAVPALVAALKSPDRSIREGVAHALGDIKPKDATSIAALIDAFEDDDDFVRWKVARALGNIGPLAKAALPALQLATSEKESEVVRAHAQRAIRRISAHPEERPAD